jgi:hypothetical protein
MPRVDLLEPLELTRRLGIPLSEVAIRLNVSEGWVRRLAKLPQHRQRVLVAELQAGFEQEQLRLSMTSLLPPRARL